MKFLKIVVPIFLVIGVSISVLFSFLALRNKPTTSPADNASSAPVSEIQFSIIKGITTPEGRKILTVLVNNFENNTSSFDKIALYGWGIRDETTYTVVYFFDDKNNVPSPEEVEKYQYTTEELPHCIVRIATEANRTLTDGTTVPGGGVNTKYPFVDGLSENYFRIGY